MNYMNSPMMKKESLKKQSNVMGKYYHFTSVDTLFSMLNNSLKFDEVSKQMYVEFWATEITALNDTTERDLFVNSLINEVRKYANEKQSSLSNEQEEVLAKFCYSDLYVISLTSNELSLSDELNMWRGYGGNGSGVCIELDFSKIPQNSPTSKKNTYQMEDCYRLCKCEYVKPEEIKIESDLVEQLYEALNSLETDYLKGTLAKANLVARIVKKAPYYKHEAYKSEHEWRFVIFSHAEQKYRQRGNFIVPYIIYKIPATAISSIKIGPCIKNTDDINSLVKFIYQKLGPQIEIKFSDIPYRS